MFNVLKNVFYDFYVIIIFKMCRYYNLEFNLLVFFMCFFFEFLKIKIICFENKWEKLDDE